MSVHDTWKITIQLISYKQNKFYKEEISIFTTYKHNVIWERNQWNQPKGYPFCRCFFSPNSLKHIPLTCLFGNSIHHMWIEIAEKAKKQGSNNQVYWSHRSLFGLNDLIYVCMGECREHSSLLYFFKHLLYLISIKSINTVCMCG